jgi:hypothetical protein
MANIGWPVPDFDWMCRFNSFQLSISRPQKSDFEDSCARVDPAQIDRHNGARRHRGRCRRSRTGTLRITGAIRPPNPRPPSESRRAAPTADRSEFAGNEDTAVGPHIPTPNNLDRSTAAKPLALTPESVMEDRRRAPPHVRCLSAASRAALSDASWARIGAPRRI